MKGLTSKSWILLTTDNDILVKSSKENDFFKLLRTYEHKENEICQYGLFLGVLEAIVEVKNHFSPVCSYIVKDSLLYMTSQPFCHFGKTAWYCYGASTTQNLRCHSLESNFFHLDD